MDDYAREVLAIEVDTSLPALRVIRVLEQLKVWRGIPKAIRLDNGPECVSNLLEQWCVKHGVELRFIQPGKPNQNAFIERFNRTFRTEVLDAWAFTSLEEVRCVTSEWLCNYNDFRPHADKPRTGAVLSKTMRLVVFRRVFIVHNWKLKILFINCPLDREAYAACGKFGESLLFGYVVVAKWRKAKP